VDDFLALDDHGADALTRVLGRAMDLADAWEARRMPQALSGLRVALVQDDGGWRNTTAFDLGIQAMGGVCVHAPITLKGAEDAADLAGYLDNWFDVVVIRTPELRRLRQLASAAKAPVINARTRSNHPFETLGDLAFALRRRRSIEGLRVAVVAPDDNILGSWAEAAAVLPIEVVQIFDARWHARCFVGSSRFSAVTDMAALASADIVITDCWPQAAEPAELSTYQVTEAWLERIPEHALFIPCPPVTRGREVSAGAMTAAKCCVFQAKAFLLHAQNALLEIVSDGLSPQVGGQWRA